MPDARKTFGDASEALAATYLMRKGMTIIARQFRTRYGEIDLIAQDRGEVVFVEVKARRSSNFGYPEESVTRTKLEKIARCAALFLRARAWDDKPYRIDVVAVEHAYTPARITHIPGVA